MLPTQGQNEANGSTSITSDTKINQLNDVKIRVEFAVEINKESDLNKIDEIVSSKTLSAIIAQPQGVRLVASDFETKTVQIELDGHRKTGGEILSVQDLQRLLEKETGFLTVLKGLGEFKAAVAELRPSSLVTCKTSQNVEHEQLVGVVRLSQLVDSNCFVDGELDGIQAKLGSRYSLAIHEFGDITSPESIGEPLINIEDNSLTNRVWSIRKVVPNCNVSAMIGRSVAISETILGEKKVLSAGVIARASTIGANKKQICSCSGKTLWEERLNRKQEEGER